jgi:hypothetical protein
LRSCERASNNAGIDPDLRIWRHNAARRNRWWN